MPENENKKKTTLGLEKVNAPDNMIGKAEVQGPSETEQAITKAFDSNIKNMETTIKGLEGARQNAVNNDETAQRRARNMQTIAGLSDGLASLANLIGVGQGGTNIDLGTGALTPLQQKAEAARLERKADIKSIDDRLDQYRRQLDQMRMQKGMAVAQNKQAEDQRAFTRAERWASQAFQKDLTKTKIEADKANLASNQAFTASENALNRKHQAELAEAENKTKTDIANANNVADITKTAIRYGNSGNKNLTQFVMDDPTTGEMRTINITDRSLTNILSTYLPSAIKNGEITEEEAEEAKNWRSNDVSKTNLLGFVNKSETLRKALLQAANDTEASEPSWAASYPPTR